MLDGVFVKQYAPPKVDEAEILRYAGQRGEADKSVRRLLCECLAESENVISCRVCYRVMKGEEAKTLFGGESTLVSRRLCKAEYAVAFAATVGLGLDKLILRYADASPTKALLFQAIGAERIESLCDTFCEEIKRGSAKRGFHARPRFSAGYGDFPIEKQKLFFTLLDCPRKIGLTLNESLLMTPTKSVTALVAIGKEEGTQTENCAACRKTDCNFRKE